MFQLPGIKIQANNHRFKVMPFFGMCWGGEGVLISIVRVLESSIFKGEFTSHTH